MSFLGIDTEIISVAECLRRPCYAKAALRRLRATAKAQRSRSHNINNNGNHKTARTRIFLGESFRRSGIIQRSFRNGVFISNLKRWGSGFSFDQYTGFFTGRTGRRESQFLLWAAGVPLQSERECTRRCNYRAPGFCNGMYPSFAFTQRNGLYNPGIKSELPENGAREIRNPYGNRENDPPGKFNSPDRSFPHGWVREKVRTCPFNLYASEKWVNVQMSLIRQWAIPSVLADTLELWFLKKCN